MGNRISDETQRSASQFGLGGVMIAIALLGLVVSIVSSAARRPGLEKRWPEPRDFHHPGDPCVDPWSRCPPFPV